MIIFVHGGEPRNVPFRFGVLKQRLNTDSFDVLRNWYPCKFTLHVRKVDKTGKIAWKGQDLFLTEALRKQWLGFEAIDNGIWKIRLAKIQIGVFDEKRHEMQWADRLAETD